MRFFLFGCIWNRFAIARKCTKLVQLMQKFMPRCLVRIFHNKRSRSIPLDPNIMFWCVSFCLGAFGTVSLLHENAPNWCNYCKSSCRVLLEFFTKNAPDTYHWTLISCFGAFLSVWVHLEPFHYCTKTCQTGAINAKVRVVLSC